MPDEVVSSVELLFEECESYNPDVTKIDEYIILIYNNKEDIKSRFPDKYSHHQTPLHMVCWMGHHAIVKRLLENSNHYKYPIDVNAICSYLDETPLHYACQRECSLIARTLLLHPNVDVNKCNASKYTPLHIACVSKKNEIVSELLKQQNINVYVTNNNNETPLEVCKRESDIDSYNEMIQLFEDCYVEKRWRAFCFLINCDLLKSLDQRNTKL